MFRLWAPNLNHWTVQEREQMRNTKLELRRWALGFGNRFGLFDHREAWRRLKRGAFAPSWGFSARFGRASRCSQGGKNGSQAATHLLRSHWSSRTFPGQATRLDQRAGQDHVIVGQSDDLGPAFHLLWGPQTRFIPQQSLFAEAIAMFHAIATPIGRPHLRQRQRLAPQPDVPTDTGLT